MAGGGRALSLGGGRVPGGRGHTSGLRGSICLTYTQETRGVVSVELIDKIPEIAILSLSICSLGSRHLSTNLAAEPLQLGVFGVSGVQGGCSVREARRGWCGSLPVCPRFCFGPPGNTAAHRSSDRPPPYPLLFVADGQTWLLMGGGVASNNAARGSASFKAVQMAKRFSLYSPTGT